MAVQTGWRWCAFCEGLFFSGNPSQGACPGQKFGGIRLPHYQGRSGRYAADWGEDSGSQQGNWRWCQKCQGMFFSGSPNQGVCPLDGQAHDGSQSGHYAILWDNGLSGTQGGWLWCRRCQAMFYAGNPDQGACPVGGTHDGSASGAYAMPWDTTPPPSQLDFDTGYIAFPNGVPVGGFAHLTLHQDGTCRLNGQFHDSGALAYNDELVWVVKDCNNQAYTFSHQGNVAGTFEPGSRDDIFDVTVQNTTVAQQWQALVAPGWPISNWQANTNVDLGGLTNSVLTAVGAVAAVVAVIV